MDCNYRIEFAVHRTSLIYYWLASRERQTLCRLIFPSPAYCIRVGCRSAGLNDPVSNIVTKREILYGNWNFEVWSWFYRGWALSNAKASFSLNMKTIDRSILVFFSFFLPIVHVLSSAMRATLYNRSCTNKTSFYVLASKRRTKNLSTSVLLIDISRLRKRDEPHIGDQMRSMVRYWRYYFKREQWRTWDASRWYRSIWREHMNQMWLCSHDEPGWLWGGFEDESILQSDVHHRTWKNSMAFDESTSHTDERDLRTRFPSVSVLES